jgi:hypothetical protein
LETVLSSDEVIIIKPTYNIIEEIFGCIECNYFTNVKQDIDNHNISKAHIEKSQPRILNIDCKHQCIECLKICKSQPSLWNHKRKCKLIQATDTCTVEGCSNRPNFNKKDEKKALYCSDHKEEGMIDIKKINKVCLIPGCRIIPVFNKAGEKQALYCSEHKEEGMVNIKSKTCESSWCMTLANKKYDGYCLFCYINLFPDKPVARNYKTKEFSVVEYVKTSFPDVNCISDKRIQDGCSKRRPDILIDLGYQVVIVEVDENQHMGYDCSCENKRLMELSQDLQHRPIIFIRFNPDEYIFENEKISSCWGNNGNGLCVIKKSKKIEWEKRLETLNSQIKYWLDENNKTDKTVEIIQLFYDKDV